MNLDDGDLTTIKNIMIGEVWICSGQSSMDIPVSGWGRIQDYEKEIADANYPALRLLQVEYSTYNVPIDEAKIANGGWIICSSQTVAPFSAVAYFFPKKIYTKTKIPVGLINAPVGGSMAEPCYCRLFGKMYGSVTLMELYGFVKNHVTFFMGW